MKEENTNRDCAKRVREIIEKKDKSLDAESSSATIESRAQPLFNLPKGIEQLVPPTQDGTKKELGTARVILQRGNKLTLEQIHCSPNQKYTLRYIEVHCLHGKSVQAYRLKELLIGVRNIQQLSREMQTWIFSQFNHRVDRMEEKVELMQLIEKREERHFQLDRIIKYLSD